MKLVSDTSEYALRAVIWLIQDPTRSQTTRQTAKGTRTPPDYMSKVLQLLTKAGLVRGRRGIGGGFRLAGKPSEITVWDVVNGADPVQRIRTCPLCLAKHGTDLCPLHCGINEATLRRKAAFSRTNAVDLLDGRSRSVPLGIRIPRTRLPFRRNPAMVRSAEAP
ncbi:MAG: Rrf2 family transcriptional regulator [Opitutaceae bacterium]